MKNSFFCFCVRGLEESECKLWVSVWASLGAGLWSVVWGVVNENAEWEEAVLDVESRLGMEVHGDDAAIAESPMQKMRWYTRQSKRQRIER
jgi:hypothetical protein